MIFTGAVVNKTYAPFVDYPPEAKIDSITRDGNLTMLFNQEMIVPPFVVDASVALFSIPDALSPARRLLALSDINVARDLIELTVLKKDFDNE